MKGGSGFPGGYSPGLAERQKIIDAKKPGYWNQWIRRAEADAEAERLKPEDLDDICLTVMFLKFLSERYNQDIINSIVEELKQRLEIRKKIIGIKLDIKETTSSREWSTLDIKFIFAHAAFIAGGSLILGSAAPIPAILSAALLSSMFVPTIKEKLKDKSGPVSKKLLTFNKLDGIRQGDTDRFNVTFDVLYPGLVGQAGDLFKLTRETYINLGVRGEEYQAKKVSDMEMESEMERGREMERVRDEGGEMQGTTDPWSTRIRNIFGKESLPVVGEPQPQLREPLTDE